MLDTPYEPPNESDSAKAAAALLTLPTLEDTEEQVRSSVEELAAFIGTLVPGMQWVQTGDRMTSGCDRPYNGTDGSKVFLPQYVAKATIPDDVWPQIFERAKVIAAALGAIELEQFHDQPGNHDVRFYSREGTAIQLASGGNTVIASITGCRLPQATMTGASPQPTPHP